MKSSLMNLLELVSANNGQIEGRKKFQKIVYILKQKGFNFIEDYKYHYYGPYSSTLQMEIDSLVQSDLLKEKRKGNTYQYIISNKGKEYINNVETNEGYINFIKELDQNSASMLELVATFFYLEDKGYNKEDEMKKKIKILKPGLISDVEDAYELFENIKFS